MKLVKVVLAALILSLFQSYAIAADLEKGEEIVTEKCQGCHGIDGNSHGTDTPKLAGQSINYLRGQLGFFRAGVLGHDTMKSIAKDLTDHELSSVAAYYASLPLERPDNVNQSLTAPGKVVFDDKCANCHGLDAKNGATPAIPVLASQKPSYVFNQMKAFQDGDRKFPWMRHAVRGLSEKEMRAVAAYVGSLN